MPTPLDTLSDAFAAAIKQATGLDADPLVAPAQNRDFGDYQSNAAMGLAKRLAAETGEKANPRALAEKIKGAVDLEGVADEVSVAGPGFINVKLSPAYVADRLGDAAASDRLGVDATTRPQTVVVEYSSPNVAKQMHVGHLRSTILGDVAARVLAFRGDRVIRQNHLGDWGTQFGMLIAHLADLDDEAGTPQKDLPDADIAEIAARYKAAAERFKADADFAERARQTVVRLQAGGPDERLAWGRLVDKTRHHIASVYARLGVELTRDDERGESFYNPRLAPLVEQLKRSGVAEASEGATVVFTPGDKAPLMVQKSDGGFGYGTTDLAAVEFRVQELKADRAVYFVDGRQQQHFRQVFAAARRAGLAPDAVSLEHASFGTVLGDDGKPLKARSGDALPLTELLDEAVARAAAVVAAKDDARPDGPALSAEQRERIAEQVGVGAVKYADLSRDRTTDYVLNFDQMLALDGNTAPYLMYAHARIRSIFRKAGIDAADRKSAIGNRKSDLSDPHELALAKHLLRFGEAVDLVARELRPHHLCAYLYDLAGAFSGFYEHCPVLTSPEPTRTSRLALCDLTARTLAKGLDLLGIPHPEQM